MDTLKINEIGIKIGLAICIGAGIALVYLLTKHFLVLHDYNIHNYGF